MVRGSLLFVLIRPKLFIAIGTQDASPILSLGCFGSISDVFRYLTALVRTTALIGEWRCMKTKSSLLDLNNGRFGLVLLIAFIIETALSIPSYSSNFVQWHLTDTSRTLGGIFNQFVVIAECRADSLRSLILLWGATIISAASFICYIQLISGEKLRQRYLIANRAKNIALLLLSCLFFSAISYFAIFLSFDICSRRYLDGRFSEIVMVLIGTDLGLGLTSLAMFMIASFCLATASKTIVVSLINSKGSDL